MGIESSELLLVGPSVRFLDCLNDLIDSDMKLIGSLAMDNGVRLRLIRKS